MAPLILIAGGYPHQLPEAVVQAFQQAGWRTEFFDLSPESPFHRPIVKPVRKIIHNLRIKRHPETFDSTPISNLGWRSRQWWKKMQALKPDAALIIRGNRIALPQLKQAAAAGFPLFCWMVEPASRISSFLTEAQARVYRQIFVYSNSYLDELKTVGATGIYYPHRAMELPSERAVINRRRNHFWSFLGGHTPHREKMLRAVMKEYPHGFLLGARWKRLLDDPLFQNVLHPGYYGQEECVALYLETRIGLDIPADPDPGTSGLTMRIPELLACGCKVLTQPSSELASIPWKPGSRLGFFTNANELIDLMREEEKAGDDESASDEILNLARSVVGHRDMVDHVTRAMESV